LLTSYTLRDRLIKYVKMMLTAETGGRTNGGALLLVMLFTLSNKTRKQNGRNIQADGVVPGRGHVATQLWHSATGGCHRVHARHFVPTDPGG
jgi:hypothetical protein